MSKLLLQITQNGMLKETISLEQIVYLEATPNTQYQVITQDGQVVPLQQTLVDGELTLSSATNTELPLVKINNYQAVSSLNNFSTLEAKTVVAEEIVENSLVNSNTVLLSLGGIALVGAVIGVGAGKSGKGNKSSDLPLEEPKLSLKEPKIQNIHVTDDNILTHSESQEHNIIIKGNIIDFSDGDKIKIKIGDIEKIIAVTDGYFEVSIDTVTALEHREIEAAVIRNGAEISERKKHHYNVEVLQTHITIDDIAQDNTINIEEAQSNTLSVTGIVENALPRSIITLVCHCANCSAIRELTTSTQIGEDGRYVANFDNVKFQDNMRYTIRAIIKEGDDTISAERTVKADLSSPNTNIKLDEITLNNIINQSSSNKILIRGAVVGLEQGDMPLLSLQVGNKLFRSINIKPDGVFELELDRESFADGDKITADLTVRDIAGNVRHSQASKSYVYDVTLNTPQITINAVPQTDNSIQLKGNITFDNDISAEHINVIVLVNNEPQSYQANVENNQWSILLPSDTAGIKEGINTFTARISVKDKADNIAWGNSSLNYDYNPVKSTSTQGKEAQKEEQAFNTDIANTDTVSTEIADAEKDSVAPADLSITLSPIEQNNYFNEFVKISGRLKNLPYPYRNHKMDYGTERFDGRGSEFIYSITLDGNGKKYSSPINRNDQSFVMEIPYAEYKELIGKSMAYSFQTPSLIFVAEREKYSSGNKIYRVSTEKAVKLTADSVEFSNNVSKVNGKEEVVFEPVRIDTKVNLNGKVSGIAKAGDTVDLLVGTHKESTTVNGDNSFSLNIDKNLISNATKIEVTLTSTETQQTATASIDIATYPEITGAFVSAHTWQAKEHRPYFLNSLIYTKNGYQDSPMHTVAAPFDPTKKAVFKYALTEQFKNSHTQAEDSIRNALNIFKESVNIDFQEVAISQSPTITYQLYSGGSSEGFAHYGGNSVNLNQNANRGEMGFNSDYYIRVILHETMHSFGAKHPFDFAHRLDAKEDYSYLTVMSYKEHSYQRRGLGLFDLAFLHFRFGVNPEARKEDNIYKFKPFNVATSDGDIYIWDGNGVDTFDASDQQQGVTVNLTPGSWNFVGEKASDTFVVKDTTELTAHYLFPNLDKAFEANGNIYPNTQHNYTNGQSFIGYGTQIEKLIGSNHNDKLTGNKANNVIWGLAGNDQIDGGEGDDRLIGGLGDDILIGGNGKDTFVFNTAIDSSKDIIKDFDPTMDKIELASTIFKDLNTGNVLGNDAIQYSQTTGELSYRYNNVDNIFAVIENKMLLTESHFEVI
ncbi:M10 family metallopeptidase C-terminal domain-containing protein [Ursidibacter sp. B-7004-1]